MKNRQLFSGFINIIIMMWLMAFLMRASEIVRLLIVFGREPGMIASELVGLTSDLLLGNTILILLYPIYHLISKWSKHLANGIFVAGLIVFMTINMLLLEYFFNQHKPLDALLFGYSWNEIVMTVGTSNVSVLNPVLTVFAIIILSVVFYYFIRKKNKSNAFGIITVISIPFAIVLTVLFYDNYNDFAKNKSLFFYKEMLKYQSTEKVYCHEISETDVKEYHNLFPQRDFISNEYPLLHSFETTDSLGYYFERFEKNPNIVIIIAEGLNDDFLYDFHGLNLMPNLREIVGKSLYWNRCFTLGVRSFAVVPSLLGSLPYGEIGFTLLDKLPLHLTLTSVLEANGYQTDFFYGQGSWFHKKNAFFNKNNIDLIFDNVKYSEKYEKIIVGDDNFFWGYNDKLLFRQSLEVIDTLEKTPRFDVYFTGSMHSPFVISDVEKYDEYLGSLCRNLDNEVDIKFFNHYRQYARTLLFFDDALAEFMNEYSKRPEYDNTIFVITGDHPITEIPPKNSLKRYHVPLLIYSPKLKENARLSNHVSHLDFYETMISFMEKYGIERTSISAALGGDLFKENDNFAFMNEPRDVADFYSDGFYITGDKLYAVDSLLNIKKIKDNEKYYELKSKLEAVRKISEYTSLENRIMPIEVYCKSLNDSLLYRIVNSDDLVFSDKYKTLVQKIDVTDFDNLILDYSLDYHGIDNKCQIVYKIVDENGNVVKTQYLGIGEDGKKSVLHQKIPLEGIGNKTEFHAFFFNPENAECTISNLDCILLGNIK